MFQVYDGVARDDHNRLTKSRCSHSWTGKSFSNQMFVDVVTKPWGDIIFRATFEQTEGK